MLCILQAMDLWCWSQKSKSFSNHLSVWFISSDQLWPNSKFSPLSDFTSSSSLALALLSCSTHDCAMLCKDAEASNQSNLYIYLCDQAITNFFVLMYTLITKRQWDNFDHFFLYGYMYKSQISHNWPHLSIKINSGIEWSFIWQLKFIKI